MYLGDIEEAGSVFVGVFSGNGAVVFRTEFEVIGLQKAKRCPGFVGNADGYAFVLCFFRKIALAANAGPDSVEVVLFAIFKCPGNTAAKGAGRVKTLADFFRMLQFAQLHMEILGEVVSFYFANTESCCQSIGVQAKAEGKFLIIDDAFAGIVQLFGLDSFLS